MNLEQKLKATQIKRDLNNILHILSRSRTFAKELRVEHAGKDISERIYRVEVDGNHGLVTRQINEHKTRGWYFEWEPQEQQRAASN